MSERGRRLAGVGLVLASALALWACSSDGDNVTGGTDAGPAVPTTAPLPEVDPRQAGMTTAFDDTETAFARAARNLSPNQLRVFSDGKELFEGEFTPEGTGDTVPGLGPRFDASSCSSCHVNDGRSRGPDGDGVLPTGMIVRLDPDTSPYGPQLQSHAVTGTGEAETSVRYEEVEGTYADGTPYSLRAPTYQVTDQTSGTLPDDTTIGVRLAPPLIGLGLLEGIPRSELQDRADPDDMNDDGVAGRIGEARVPWLDQPVFGRFGWQASAADVEHQLALALIHDMNVTTGWFPTEACDHAPWDEAVCPRPDGPATEGWTVDGWTGEPLPDPPPSTTELGDRDLFTLTLYSRALAVPAIRDVERPAVRRGRAVFEQVGCASCHDGGYTTDETDMSGLSGQRIDPGTDLLLYDMGDGLADRTIGGQVVESHWRTAPLWGLGLADVVLGEPATYLHDGRARTVEEAILWHGGDAAASQASFLELSEEDRADLLTYLAAR
jgi:CxxC motif-containing protein (DUF1111 family)